MPQPLYIMRMPPESACGSTTPSSTSAARSVPPPLLLWSPARPCSAFSAVASSCAAAAAAAPQQQQLVDDLLPPRLRAELALVLAIEPPPALLHESEIDRAGNSTVRLCDMVAHDQRRWWPRRELVGMASCLSSGGGTLCRVVPRHSHADGHDHGRDDDEPTDTADEGASNGDNFLAAAAVVFAGRYRWRWC